MSASLLDANVLIALTLAEHVHHDYVSAWRADAGDVVLCPIVERALVRFLVRLGESAQVAIEVLRLLHADLSHVRGHRQVSDAYLAALALSRHDALVVTVDRRWLRPGPRRLG